jgi:hypothetical protein
MRQAWRPGASVTSVIGRRRWLGTAEGCGRIRPPALALASVVWKYSLNWLLRLKPSGVDADALSGAELTEVNEERWY